MSKNTFAFPIPPTETFGAWRTEGAEVWVGPTVSPWRELFEALDEIGEALPEVQLTLAEEATAIFASCWRYGSYAHVLTQGAPLPEALRSKARVSRVTNGKMRRIQIEFTAALAAWWELEDKDPELAQRRARAAWEFLPMPECALHSDDVIVEHLAGKLHALQAELKSDPEAEKFLTKEWAVRHQANATVARAYREGPIESLHAGKVPSHLPE